MLNASNAKYEHSQMLANLMDRIAIVIAFAFA